MQNNDGPVTRIAAVAGEPQFFADEKQAAEYRKEQEHKALREELATLIARCQGSDFAHAAADAVLSVYALRKR